MKYIVIKEAGAEQAVIFSEAIQHSTFFTLPIVSAGYVTLDERQHASVRGESIGLGKKSRPDDANIIEHSIHFKT